MAKGYRLQSNESIIMKSTEFNAEDYESNIRELILTSQNLVIIWNGKKRISSAASVIAGMGSTLKEVYTLGLLADKDTIDVLPLSLIKVRNNQAQVFFNDQKFRPTLDMYFNDGTNYSFTTNGDGWTEKKINANIKNKILPWVFAINRAVTGQGPDDVNYYDEESRVENLNKAIPGSKFVAETIRDTVGTFGATFGLNIGKSSSDIQELRNNKVATKCRACGAPATGYKGQVIKCQYCDTDNQL